MDLETTNAIDDLRKGLGHVEWSLTARIDGLDASLTGRFDSLSGRVDSLSGRFDSVSDRVDSLSGRFDSLSGRVDSLSDRVEKFESSLTARMLSLHDDSKRHADVLCESLRDDIRMLAEAVVTLSAKMDRRW